MPDKAETFGYVIDDRPGTMLVIGVRKGRVRPEVWLRSDEHGDVVLGALHGEKHAKALTNFLDTMTDAINRAIDYHKNQGDGNP